MMIKVPAKHYRCKGLKTTFSYDEDGYVTSITDTAGSINTFS